MAEINEYISKLGSLNIDPGYDTWGDSGKYLTYLSYNTEDKVMKKVPIISLLSMISLYFKEKNYEDSAESVLKFIDNCLNTDIYGTFLPMRRSIYGGSRFFGITEKMREGIFNGTYSGLFIGDYFEDSSKNCRHYVAGFNDLPKDYYGNTVTMFSFGSTTGTENISTKYEDSNVRYQLNYGTIRESLENLGFRISNFQDIFDSNQLDYAIELPTMPQIYGVSVFEIPRNDSVLGIKQLDLFRLNPSFLENILFPYTGWDGIWTRTRNDMNDGVVILKNEHGLLSPRVYSANTPFNFVGVSYVGL